MQSLAGYQAVLAILGQNQTITQKAARFWSVEHYSIWQGMTQAPSVLRKRHIHGKTKIEQELFFKKTTKREMDKIRAKRRELPLQWWSLYGSVDDFG